MLSALVPLMAFAQQRAVDSTPYWGQICYPDANHCTTLTGQALYDEVVAYGFTLQLEDVCTPASSSASQLRHFPRLTHLTALAGEEHSGWLAG